MNTNLIMIAVGTVVAVSEAKSNAKTGKLSMQPVVGGFIVGVFLFGLDAVSPFVAKWFSILLIIGAMLKMDTSVNPPVSNGTYLLKMIPGQN